MITVRAGALSPGGEERLLGEAVAEQRRAGDWQAHFSLDLSSILQLCANLQLALRHPGNTGPAADTARTMVDRLRAELLARGFTAHAEIIALGDDPANEQVN